MRRFFQLLALLYFAIAAYGIVRERAEPHGLPHRPPTGNHGQGAMIDATRCPAGAIPFYTDDPPLFLECMSLTSTEHTP